MRIQTIITSLKQVINEESYEDIHRRFANLEFPGYKGKLSDLMDKGNFVTIRIVGSKKILEYKIESNNPLTVIDILNSINWNLCSINDNEYYFSKSIEDLDKEINILTNTFQSVNKEKINIELYRVKKVSSTSIVSILPRRKDGKFSFVNLTKGHICSCKFDTIEDALRDMADQKEAGLIIDYEKIQ